MNRKILQKPPRKYDMRYNTILTPDQEKIYQQWVNSLPINLRGDYDYDLRGAWLNGDQPDEYYHMPDTWKKPWHPTFSNESIYSTPGAEGGRWDGEEFHPSRLNKTLQSFKFGEWGGNTFAKGGPKKRIITNPEWTDFQSHVQAARLAENIAASKGDYWNQNWFDPNYKSGAYTFDDNGLLTYQGQTYAPFGDASKQGIMVPVRTPSGISYGAIAAYYPVSVPQQFIEEEYYEPEPEPKPEPEPEPESRTEVTTEPLINSPAIAKQNSARKKIPTTQGQRDIDISFARFYKERGKDSIGKKRHWDFPWQDVKQEYETWVDGKLRHEYQLKYLSDEYKTYWHNRDRNTVQTNENYVRYGGVTYILPFSASNNRKDVWRGLYSEKDYADYSKGMWQKEKRDRLGSMHGLFPSLATEIKINNQGDTLSYRVSNPVTQSNLQPKKEYGSPSDFTSGSVSINGSKRGYKTYYQERTGYDDSVVGRGIADIKDYWSDGIGNGLRNVFSSKGEDGLIKKIKKAATYSKEGMPTFERIRKVFKSYGGNLYVDDRPDNPSSRVNLDMLWNNNVSVDNKSFSDGGSIHIKPENRGKFTAAAKRVGKSVQEYASQILAHKENYSPTLVKRANFARVFGGKK